MKATQRFGVLGEKLGHSRSPQIHALLGDYPYGLFEVAREDLADFLKHGVFDGLNVTIPYKREVIPFLDELSEEAAKIGSVNTIVRRNGRLIGCITDYYGFSCLLDTFHVDVSGKKAVVLGSGGASRAIQAVLTDRGVKSLVVVSRQGEENYGNLARHADADVVINATPVGMYPHIGVSPVDPTLFPRCGRVIDIVYNPLRTQLMLDCEKNGIPFAGGMTMLVAQAKRSAELFTGTVIDDAVIGEITSRMLFEMADIVLIGMPGCGKTAVAAAMAENTGLTACDSDSEIEARFSVGAGEMIRRDGEAQFRKIETQVLDGLCRGSHRILSTGGGAVTSEENYDIL